MAVDIGNREWFIYVLKDPRTDDVRYVGFTYDTGKRLKSHTNHAKYFKTHKDRWIQSLQKDGVNPVMTIIDRGFGEWKSVEQFWVLHYRMQCARLTNSTDGGDGGLRCSPETRQRMSDSKKGHKHSPETKAKIGTAHKGMKHSPENIEKMKNRETNKSVYRVEDMCVFPSIISAARAMDVDAAAVNQSILSGGTCAGFHWAFYGMEPIVTVNKNRHRVRCVETGEIFESVRAAAKSVGAVESSISIAIKKGGRSSKLHWEYVDTDKRPPDKMSVRRVEDGKVFVSIASAARDVGSTSTCIRSSIIKGCRAAGYHWERVENG